MRITDNPFSVMVPVRILELRSSYKGVTWVKLSTQVYDNENAGVKILTLKEFYKFYIKDLPDL